MLEEEEFYSVTSYLMIGLIHVVDGKMLIVIISLIIYGFSKFLILID